ncbi:MAG: ATP-grasp domain-containing protein [Pirellulales bacterium]
MENGRERVVVCLEYATGGGGYEDPTVLSADGAFLREGAAMLRAVVADLKTLPGIRPVVLCDVRWSPGDMAGASLRKVSSLADLTSEWLAAAHTAHALMLIAPECGGTLARWTEMAEDAGGRLWTPGSQFVRLASDKQATAEWLARGGVAVPRGRRLEGGEAFPDDVPYPAVLKPIDGAGSLDLRWLPSPPLAERVPERPGGWRLEEFRAGRAASVLVCGSGETPITLPASWQRLSDDGTWHYLGGTTPIPEPWQTRARNLALQAARVLPPTHGFFGFDLVLGEAEDGGDDVVIEVNPRLTTSYIGVRRVLGVNPLRLVAEPAVAGQLAENWRDLTGVLPVDFGPGQALDA